MRHLRHLFLRRPLLACWLIALALLMRVAVPAGYMPAFSGGSITIELCSSYGPVKVVKPMAAMPGMAGHHQKGGHNRAEMPCGFSGLAMPSLAGADAILLAIAIAFILATAFHAIPPRRIVLPAYLRPPLRGPPATA